MAFISSHLVAVIFFMVIGYSPMTSVFYSILLAFVMSFLTRETAIDPDEIRESNGGRLDRRARSGDDVCRRPASSSAS